MPEPTLCAINSSRYAPRNIGTWRLVSPSARPDSHNANTAAMAVAAVSRLVFGIAGSSKSQTRSTETWSIRQSSTRPQGLRRANHGGIAGVQHSPYLRTSHADVDVAFACVCVCVLPTLPVGGSSVDDGVTKSSGRTWISSSRRM